MSETKNKLNKSQAKTLVYVFVGAISGAILGIIAYANNWLG